MRIGLYLFDSFIGFHFYSLRAEDFLAISASATYGGGRFTIGGIFVLYGVEFEVAWGLDDEE